MFAMGLIGRFVVDAHVRTTMVVEGDETGNDVVSFHPIGELRLAIDYFVLYHAVDSLGNGIVGRRVILRHADGDVVFLQFGDVVVTAVLHPSVGMIY